MKKIFVYITALTACLAVSCTENLDLLNEDYALSFEAQVTDMETRAVTGEDAYHENDITTMDWFFFSDEEGTTLLHHVTTSGTNARILNIPTATVEAKGLRGKS